MLKETGNRQRESVPFTRSHGRRRHRRADVLVAARSAETHDEDGGARVATVVRARQAAAQLHAPRDRLLRRGRADLGATLGRGRDRDAARGTRLAARPRTRSDRSTRKEWQYYYSSAAGNADLGRLQAQFDEYYDVLAGQRRARQLHRGAGARASARTATSRTSSRSPAAGLVVRGGAILHRYGLGSWQRGREVIWAKALAALQVPIYLHDPRTRASASPAPAAGSTRRRSSSTRAVVANEEGLRQLEIRARDPRRSS